MSELSTIEEVLAALRAGKPVLVSDAEDRENEGDAIIAAEFATTEWLAWMIRYTSGYICAPMSNERANALDLPLMWVNSTDPHQTAYTVTVDAANRESTGISASERALTARVLADPASEPKSLLRPGHVVPLRARDGGVLERPGHTEAAVDLMKLAGLQPVAMMAEMVNDDGTMMRFGELLATAKRFELPMTTIAHLKDHLGKRQGQTPAPANRIRFEAEANVPTTHGDFRLRGYYDVETTADHVALISGNPTGAEVMVRLHSECITGEAFGSLKCECGPQLEAAMDEVAKNPAGGVVIYLRGQEGRGIGLLNKLKAYALQEKGYDTVDANLALGLPSEAREYGAAVAILKDLGITSVRLMTNNPAKSKYLIDAGIPVTETVPLVVGLAKENLGYLQAKRERMGHQIPANL
ncbi:3,4-dihydroxy-2-butanone-4-phosphate synthase [Aquiluna borgnonia]|jgi:3,4-dihydroxy 2-butanone 4-phosphate synthase/GTP cyclohydrolase II|uniref:GTP cyclohydrolase-2 n=1 Tax=Aquiluna borgnonia TaxID=2499157 RepID=A0A7D4QM99_9MICO|nr:3,4-dihydroxy-2-butanone-4-phosphate synthase [Aquiluna borgnonia]QKJ24847.1 3,4-dihydroxy-2-butanone-4-phosphate synthase [Aquiluna borgnonia]